MKDGKYMPDGPMDAAIKFILLVVASIWCLAVVNSCGCTPHQQRMFTDAFVNVADCALYTSLGCASQSVSGCDRPAASGGDYRKFGKCLVGRSSSCAGRGLSLCLLGGIVNVAGTSSVVAGGVGCTGEIGISKVNDCVSDTTLESESDTVQAVAACYRMVCMEMP